MSLGKSLPVLHTLVLTGNAVQELSDLEALGGCGRLVHLTLVGNPVVGKEVSGWRGNRDVDVRC